MSEKKIPISASPQDDALEKRVDAMMDNTKGADQVAAPKVPTKIDVSKYVPAAKLAAPSLAPSAPELPKRAAKKIEISNEDDAEPVEPPAAVPVQDGPLTDAAVLTVADAVEHHETHPDTETPLDDDKTDAAIDDIAAHDSDTLLEKEDTAKTVHEPVVIKKPKSHRLRRIILIIMALLIVTLAGLLALPATRYEVLGLAIKRSIAVNVIDDETKQPVSSAVVMIDGTETTTNAEGKVTIKSPVGPRDVVVSKQYYAATTQKADVALMGDNTFAVELKATGRRVPIKVVNKITGKPIEGAVVEAASTSSKTDKTGQTTIVLPTESTEQSATVSFKDYNSQTVVIKVTAASVPANTFSITPAGTVYTLSNENGTIDVVKMNLDGTSRKTVVKGTGSEDQASTVLLASRDWRYVVLKAQRDKPQASMYLLDTSNDRLTEFDSGDASFTPIGWHDHTFMYDVVRNTVSTSQDGHELIKSYDAERGQLNQLDQNQASASDNDSYTYQGFYNFYILNDQLIYNTQWYSSGGAALNDKTNSIRGIKPNGQGKKDYQTFEASSIGYVQAALKSPQTIYYAAHNYQDNKTAFLEFADGSVKISADLDQSDFNRSYPSYLTSPSGKKVLWSEQRNGRATPIIGAQNAGSERVLSALADYSAYGWYGDDYVLVSKDNNELFIVSTADAKTPIKVTDYFKPERGVPGYGYGYGGL